MVESQLPKSTILLAQAGPERANTLVALLTAQGYRVHTVATGAQALAEVEHTAIDLILMDSSLPQCPPPVFCQHLKEAGTARTPPVIVLTQSAEPETIAEVLAAGVADVWIEPLQEHLFLARLQAHLELVTLRNELALRNNLLEKEIASRRQVEESVRVAELSGRELVENLSEVIYTADLDGTLTYVSPGIERLLGYTPEQAIGRHLAEFVDPEFRPQLAERLPRVLSGHREANEYRLLAMRGDTRWVHTSSQPIYSDQQVIGLQGVLTDISEHVKAEEQIREQNEFLTSVLESLTHPFYVLNVHDYTIQMANSAARRANITGGATCYALTHRRDTPCNSADHPCPIEELRRTGKPVTVEHLHYDAQDNQRFVEVHSYPLFDAQGNLVRAIEYTLDITERKLAEEALRESEARWRSVTENSPDHVILLDASLNIEFLNYPSPGLTMDQLIGTPLHAYAPEGRQPEVKSILARVLESGEPASYETEYHTPSADTIYYESRAVPRIRDGQIVGLAVNARDISEHKRAELALRKASRQAEQARQAEQERRREADQRRRVAEGLAGVMGALNSDQPLDQVLDHIAFQARELLANEAVTIYSLDQTERALVPQAVQGPVWADRQAITCACNLQAIAQALASHQPFTLGHDLEAGTPDSDGQPTGPFRALLAVPIIVRQEAYGGLVMCGTEPRSYSVEEVELASVFANQVALAVESARLRKEREQAAAAAERNRLARDLHDSVTQALFSATLVAEVLPQVWERDPALAHEGLQELGALTRGALAEMRTMLLELRPTAILETRLDSLVRQLAEAVTSRAELVVSYDIEPAPILPPEVHVTFYRVAQEALNNVLKHAEATNITVSLVAQPPVASGPVGDWHGQLELTISDDGRGIPAGDLHADQLGLSIMRERAEAIGATLDLVSHPDRGTHVTLRWPISEPATGA